MHVFAYILFTSCELLAFYELLSAEYLIFTEYLILKKKTLQIDVSFRFRNVIKAKLAIMLVCSGNIIAAPGQ